MHAFEPLLLSIASACSIEILNDPKFAAAQNCAIIHTSQQRITANTMQNIAQQLTRDEIKQIAEQVGYDLPVSQNQWAALQKFLALVAQKQEE